MLDDLTTSASSRLHDHDWRASPNFKAKAGASAFGLPQTQRARVTKHFFTYRIVGDSKSQSNIKLPNQSMGVATEILWPIHFFIEDTAHDNPDLQRAENRLSFLASIDVTESFEELSPPTIDVIREAWAILRKLASLDSDIPLPNIGLDSDGSIVFTFDLNRNGAIGSLSLYGDGTYSYYIEKAGEAVKRGDALIAEPIDQELQNLLMR